VFTIAGGPFAAAAPGAEIPACLYFTAIFQRLFEVLVDRRAEVQETACACMGGGAVCRFEAHW
jgi:bacteriochlorophyll 4-vinyl reductase